jgi:hypothetical protein
VRAVYAFAFVTDTLPLGYELSCVLRLRYAWSFSSDLADARPAFSHRPREDPMRTKLKLNLDQLAVDSFDTTKTEAKTGTVFGEQCTCYTNCTCPGCYTCDASCNGTCGASCNGTCYENTCACTDTQYDTCNRYNCGYTALQTNCNEMCL